jgi:hypothetical protein
MRRRPMTDHHKHYQEDSGFEHEDLNAKPVIGFIVSLLISGVLIYYAIWGIFHFLDAYDRKNQQSRTPLIKVETNTRDIQTQLIQRFPDPRLEDNERTELDGFRYSEEQELNSYGWVDKNAGVAHIPIEKAMQLIAQKGLQTTPQTGIAPFSPVNLARAAAATADTSGMTPQEQTKTEKGKKK